MPGCRLTVRTVATLLVVAAGAGCSGGAGEADALPSTPSVGSSAGPTDTGSPVPSGPGAELVMVATQAPEGRAEARAFADYVTFWQRDMVALRTNDLVGSGVLGYLITPQLDATRKYLDDARKAGRHTEGTVTISPRVQSVRGPYATITDCLDQSATQDVDRTDGAARPTRPRWRW